MGILVFCKIKVDIAFFILACGLCYLAYKRVKERLIAIVLAFFAALFICNSLNSIYNKVEIKRDYQVEALVIDKKEVASGDLYDLKVTVKELDRTFYSCFYSKENFQIGDVLEGVANFDKAPSSANFKTFNYRRYLMTKKIFLVVYKGKLHYKKKGSALLKLKRDFNFVVKSNLDRAFDTKTSHLAQSLVLGNKAISKGDLDGYNSLGISHILAISGLHISILIKFFNFFGYIFKLERKKYAIFVTVILLIYGYLISFPISLIRALTTYIIKNLAIYTNNVQDELNQIALSAFISLLINPFYIYGAAFWLSYIAAFSVNYICVLLKNNIKKEGFIANIIISNSSIQLGMLPIQVYLFNHFNILSLPVNIIIIQTMAIPVALAYLGAMGIFSYISIFNGIFQGLSTRINNCIMSLSKFDLLDLNFSSPNIISIAIAYIFLILSLNYYRFERIKREKLIKIFSVFFVSLVLARIICSSLLICKVNIVDVGQGDGILIRSAGKAAMVDMGGQPKRAEKGVEELYEYLHKNGIRQLDLAFFTHGDYDHVGNFEGIKKKIKVNNVLVGPTFKKKLSCRKRVVKKGDRIRLSKVYFEIILDGRDGETENDRSIIMILHVNDHKLMLTGDVEKEELKISRPADILKVAHHGSKHSSRDEFLDRVKPKLALISAGQNNGYGHPTEEVLDRLKKRKIETYSTVENGNIELSFYKGFYTIHSYYGRRSLLELMLDFFTK